MRSRSNALRTLRFASALALLASVPAAAQLPRAVFTDPPHDARHPARMEVLHIPSGGVKINGVAYLAAGAGVHPTFVLLHGLPGNEKNLDLAQAVRRDGWNAITFNFRGSWGSPGVFRFAQALADADAVLAFLRDTSNVRALGIDTTRLVLAGHSMGGWATVRTASHDHRLAGAVLISAADMGALASRKPADVVKGMANNMESLAGVTPQSMANEIIANGSRWAFTTAESGLASTPLLVITSNDGFAPSNDSLVAALRKLGNRRIATAHFATDHSYSDQRIALESAVLRWLEALRK